VLGLVALGHGLQAQFLDPLAGHDLLTN
jgi:hypothetical protein